MGLQRALHLRDRTRGRKAGRRVRRREPRTHSIVGVPWTLGREAGLGLRDRPDLPIEIGLLPEELLLLRQVRLPCRVWAAFACDPGNLLIDVLELLPQPLKLA